MHASKLAWAIDQTACIKGSTKAAGTIAVAAHRQLSHQQSGCTPVAAHACATTLSSRPTSSSDNWLQHSTSSTSCRRRCSSSLMTWRPWPVQVACQAGRHMCHYQYSSSSSRGTYQLASLCWNAQLQPHHCYSSWINFTRARSVANKPMQASTSSGNSSSPRLPAVSEISSASNPYIKHCVKLRESARYRQQQRRLLLVGATLLSELAEESSCLHVLMLFKRPDTLLPPGVSAQQVITVTDSVMKKLTGLEEAAGVQMVAELALPDYINPASWQHSSQQQLQQHTPAAATAAQAKQLQRLLVLEGVQDPGNLGTLLRCAAAFGWDAVWLLPGCCDPFNDKALRASRGAALRWPLAAGTLQELLAVVQQHNMMLLAAHPEDDINAAGQQQQQQQQMALSQRGNCSSTSSAGAASPEQQQQPAVCLVLGTEGAGLSADVLALATPLSIPMSGHMESLNVGVAGAILMFVLSDGINKLLGRLKQLGQL